MEQEASQELWLSYSDPVSLARVEPKDAGTSLSRQWGPVLKAESQAKQCLQAHKTSAGPWKPRKPGVPIGSYY